MRKVTQLIWLMTLLAALAACAPLAPVPQATVPPRQASTALPTNTPPPRPTATMIAVTTSTPDPGALTLDWTTTSPDGQWTATSVNARLNTGQDYYVRLRVEGAAGAEVWTAVEEWRPFGMGYTLPGPVQWSADGQRFYFTNVPHPDGCLMFVNGGDLHMLDLNTGQVTALMPEQALWIALAPDETRLAYIGYGERGLILRDLATGQEQSVAVEKPTDLAGLGAMLWSPAGTALVLTAAHEQCAPGAAHSIFHVDIATGAVRTLVDGDPRGLTTVAWPEVERVQLEDKDGAVWWLDVATGSVSAA
jgi:hypothetical protein